MHYMLESIMRRWCQTLNVTLNVQTHETIDKPPGVPDVSKYSATEETDKLVARAKLREIVTGFIEMYHNLRNFCFDAAPGAKEPYHGHNIPEAPLNSELGKGANGTVRSNAGSAFRQHALLSWSGLTWHRCFACMPLC